MKSVKILGIEFGSTRIKAVLTDAETRVLASGSYGWENRLLSGGIWSYRMSDAIKGMQSAFAEMKADYRRKSKSKLDALDAIGISGMMQRVPALRCARTSARRVQIMAMYGDCGSRGEALSGV